MPTFVIAIWILCQFSLFSTQTPPACKSTLLSDLPDTAFSASSNVSQKYSAPAARMSPGDGTLQYRAWCPDSLRPQEETEFLEVDLSQQSFVRLIITKGLSTADKGGLYLTPFYYIRYRREESHQKWIKYQNINGTERIKGNLDAQTERYVSMNPPFVARWIRIYPFTHDRHPVCLKVEIIGCRAYGVVEYQAPRGHPLAHAPKDRLVDLTYDNYESRQSQTMEFSQNVINTGGLGKLIDGKPDHETDVDPLDVNTFVGWKRSDDAAFSSEYERLVFRFDGIYNFTGVSMLLANRIGTEDSRPRHVELRLSRKFPRASSTDPATTLLVVHQFPPLVNTLSKAAWIHVDILSALTEYINTNASSIYYNNLGTFMELRIYYASSWIALAEVAFQNARVQVPPGLVLYEESEEASATSLPFDLGMASSQKSLSAMPPHTYALVVGLSCLATLLILFFLALFVHWRRRALLSKHKVHELNRSFQHPFSMPPIKTTTRPTGLLNSDTDQKWNFYNSSSAIRDSMHSNGGNMGYVPSSTGVVSQFLLQQPVTGGLNCRMHKNYAQKQVQSNQISEPASNAALCQESSALYATTPESDAYANGAPQSLQNLRIPPPPSLPLPPTPTQPHSVAEWTPQWTGAVFSQENDFMRHRELNDHTFYRYSIPFNAAFPSTPLYSAPVWVAGAVNSVQLSPMFGQQPYNPQATPKLNECLPGTPVSSIIYGMREPRQSQTGPTLGALSN